MWPPTPGWRPAGRHWDSPEPTETTAAARCQRATLQRAANLWRRSEGWAFFKWLAEGHLGAAWGGMEPHRSRVRTALTRNRIVCHSVGPTPVHQCGVAPLPDGLQQGVLLFPSATIRTHIAQLREVAPSYAGTAGLFSSQLPRQLQTLAKSLFLADYLCLLCLLFTHELTCKSPLHLFMASQLTSSPRIQGSPILQPFLSRFRSHLPRSLTVFLQLAASLPTLHSAFRPPQPPTLAILTSVPPTACLLLREPP